MPARLQLDSFIVLTSNPNLTNIELLLSSASFPFGFFSHTTKLNPSFAPSLHKPMRLLSAPPSRQLQHASILRLSRAKEGARNIL